MSVALHGNLRDFGIGEVFQLIGHQRKTGVLEVTGDDERLRIAFDHGSVVSAEPIGPYDHWALGDLLVRVGLVTPVRLAEAEAEAGPAGDLRDLLAGDLGSDAVEEISSLVTSEAIFRLLQRQRGSFHFTPEAVPHGRDPAQLLPAEQILMDGLRMVDEWRALDPVACRDDTVFRRVGDFESFRGEQTHESSASLRMAERLFLLIDGRLGTRRVVDLSRVGSFEGARWLSIMHRAGLIAPVQARSTGVRRVAPEDAGRLRLALGAVPFVLLLLLVVAAWQRSAPTQGPGIGVHAASQRAALAAEARRLRHAIDAYQMATGEWPKRLDTLLRAPGARPPLAPAEPAPYYYARSGESYLLLPPLPSLAQISPRLLPPRRSR